MFDIYFILSLYKNLFKQTAIYGLATVLPRMLSFLLVTVHTDNLVRADYGETTILLTYMIFFNVILSYGMETAFFRFYSAEEDKKKVIQTSTVSIFWTTILFLVVALLFRNLVSTFIKIDVQYITYAIWILVLDALVIIPFSKLRAQQRPVFYTIIKTGNVCINMLLNLFFLIYLPKLAHSNPEHFWNTIYFEHFQIGYIFLANLIASLATFIVFVPEYFKLHWKFDVKLWRKMMNYGFPVLIAGIAFAVNEHLDKIILEKLLPEDIAKAEVGIYSACYKLGLFMILFATAFRLGVEPFFFSHSKNENAKQTYANITKYFVILGSLILITVIVFSDIIKEIMIKDQSYWEAMIIVPLIILANFFLGIYNNLSVWYKLTDKTKIGAYISIIGAILTLVLNYLLIPTYSYIGSAIATIVAYGSMMVISYVLGQKYYPIPYDMRRIGMYLGVSILFSGIYFYRFRENYYIGALFIIIFASCIYISEKQTINQILKRKNK